MMNLKKTMLFLLIAASFFCIITELHAQIGIQIKISQTSYLPFEPVFVRVSITNRAAHPLAFGSNERLKGTLRFEIDPLDGPVKRSLPLKDASVYPPLTGSIIPPGATKEYTFNLCDYYDLQLPGRYVIKAVLKHSLLQHEYLSQPAYISIVKGQTVWKTEVGLPSITGNNVDEKNKIKLRRYSILTYNTGSSLVYNLLVESRCMGIHDSLAVYSSLVPRSLGRMFLESDADASLFHGICRILRFGLLHQAIRCLVGA